MTKSFLTGVVVLNVPLQSWVTPRSCSYTMTSSERNSFSRSRVRIVGYTSLPPWNNLTVLMYPLLQRPWLTAVRIFSEQESSRHNKVTTSLGWAVTMCARPYATLDCKKRSDSRLAASRWRMGGLSTTAFVNRANRCLMADSSVHSWAVSLFFEPYVLGAAHH